MPFHQCMSDRAATAEVAEAERIVAIDEDAGAVAAAVHCSSLPLVNPRGTIT